MPTEDGVQRAGEHGHVDGCVRPAPERPVGLVVRPQQAARRDGGLADPQRQAFGFHAVLHRQHARLEQLALRAVGLLGGISRDCTGLLRERQVGVARPVGSLHVGVARQRRRDAEFLLLQST